MFMTYAVFNYQKSDLSPTTHPFGTRFFLFLAILMEILRNAFWHFFHVSGCEIAHVIHELFPRGFYKHLKVLQKPLLYPKNQKWACNSSRNVIMGENSDSKTFSLDHTTSNLPILPQKPPKIQANWGRMIIFSKVKSRDLRDVKNTSKHFQRCIRMSQGASLM